MVCSFSLDSVGQFRYKSLFDPVIMCSLGRVKAIYMYYTNLCNRSVQWTEESETKGV